MKNNKEKGLKISDLARITGVPKSTIHYYVKMGLLPDPVKTSPNMAYYDKKCVDQVTLIKELQNRKFIPLEHIKHLIWHVVNENVPANLLINTHNLIFDFNKRGEKFLTAEQFRRKTGLTESEMNKALSMKLLLPTGETKAPYNSDDVQIGLTMKKMMKVGIQMEDIVYYPRIISEIVRMDLELHDRITKQTTGYKTTEFFQITEGMLESAFLARDYFFKRLFSMSMIDHINNEIKENKLIKTNTDREEK